MTGFYNEKYIETLMLGWLHQIYPLFVSTNLQMQNSVSSWKKKKTFPKKSRKDVFDGTSIVFTR